jgi:hypothetical protein
MYFYTLPCWHHVSWLRWAFVRYWTCIVLTSAAMYFMQKKVLNALTACVSFCDGRLLLVLSIRYLATQPHYMPRNTKYFTLKLRTSRRSRPGVFGASDRNRSWDAWPTGCRGSRGSILAFSPNHHSPSSLSFSLLASLVSSRLVLSHVKLYYCTRQVG